MTQNAVVKRLLDRKMAEVEVERKSACGHDCSKCHGCAEMAYTKQVVTVAHNEIGATVGDHVVIETENKQMFGIMALVYALPIVLFFVGYVLARLLGLGDGVSSALGVVGFFMGIGGAVWYNRRLAGKTAVTVRITAKS